MTLAKEEQGECTRKKIHATQGKKYSNSLQRHRMKRSSMDITLEENEWEVEGGGAISREWDVLLEERADGRCDFPLILLSCLQKTINGNCEQGCE